MAAAESSGVRAVEQIARELGDLTFNDGRPGRPVKIKNHEPKK
jgi:hypothetical protein